MNKKKKQNGFTIVELVIVIAVIGILAAVLIPTFSNLIKKSKQSADQQLVYHLNEAVVANEVDNLAKGKNGTEATMYDTLQVLDKEYGFTVERMTPRSGNDIVWDSTTNRFALVAKDNKVVYTDPNNPSKMENKAKMWRITEAGERLDDGYSHYLTAGWTGEVPAVATGLDVGENDDITAVTYKHTTGDAQTVVVRTNGGTLTVNAPADTVNHYGEATVLNIEAVDTENCYREFGTVANAQIKKGKIVIESAEAKVENLLLVAKADKSGFEKIVVETKTGAELPTLDRTDVTIADNGTLVLNVVTPSTDEYIYLTKAGVIEQIVVTNEIKNDVSGETANVASKSETTQAVAEQVANVGTKNEDGNYVDSNGNEIALEDLTSENVVIAEAKANEAAVQTGMTKFSGGAGTKNSPYLISSEEQLRKIGNNSSAVYYKLINDIELTFKEVYKDTYGNYLNRYVNNAYIDGDDYNLIISSNGSVFSLIEYLYNSKISNLSILYNREWTCSIGELVSNTIFENVNIGNPDSDITIKFAGNNRGMFADQPVTNSYVKFINCTNYYNVEEALPLKSKSYGVFLGWLPSKSYTIDFKDCANYGDIFADHAGLLSGNGQGVSTATINVSGFKNYGLIMGLSDSSALGRNKDYDTTVGIDNSNFIGYDKFIIIKDNALSIDLNEDSKLVITKAEQYADKYSINVIAYSKMIDIETKESYGTMVGSYTFVFDNPTFDENNKLILEYGKFRMMDYDSYYQKFGNVENWENNAYFDAVNNIIVINFEKYNVGNIKCTLDTIDPTIIVYAYIDDQPVGRSNLQ